MEVKLLTSSSSSVSSAVSDLEKKIEEYLNRGYTPQGGISTTFEYKRYTSNDATASIVMVKN